MFFTEKSEEEAKENGVLNFFRRIVTNQLSRENQPKAGELINLRQPEPVLSAMITDRNGKKAYGLQQAARELQARLQSESATNWPVSDATPAHKPGTIYKYRSKADITYTNLPAIVVNQ